VRRASRGSPRAQGGDRGGAGPGIGSPGCLAATYFQKAVSVAGTASLLSRTKAGPTPGLDASAPMLMWLCAEFVCRITKNFHI